MREILFRGKRLDNGEWAYGDLVRSWIQTSKDNGRLIPEIKWQFVDENGEMWNDHEEVDPTTIGQYTGLKDKNGTKIFDGDIVLMIFFKDSEEPYRFTGTAEYKEQWACYVATSNEGSHMVFDESVEVEVIGNIHDKEGTK